MKRILILISFSILCFACSKNEKGETTAAVVSNTAKLISDTKGMQLFGISISVGHSGKGCAGCVTSGGQHIHVDCQGPGNACTKSARMSIASAKGAISGIIEDSDELTDGEFFFMPDRSLYIIDSNGEFLNIPEQIVFRDEETGAFIFYDIFFSDSQTFENE